MATNKKASPKIDTNSWMATYTDLMILLLTFFVLLLSLSTVDKKRKRLALNSLVGAFGFKPGGQSILGKPKGLNITSGSAPLEPEEIHFEQLRNVALRHGLESELSMSKQIDRSVITLSNMVLFDRGSYKIKPDYMEYLTELAEAIKGGPQLIELRGYTDSTENIFMEEPYKFSMNLSAKRAMAIFKYFLEKGGIPAETMVAHGFGENPAGFKNRGEKTGLNRQVEIILDYSEKVPYRLKKTIRKKSILDFNGFFFRTAGDTNE